MAGITLRLAGRSEFLGSWASSTMREASDEPIEDVGGLGEAAVWVPDMGALVALAEDRTHILIGSGDREVKRQIMERILARP